MRKDVLMDCALYFYKREKLSFQNEEMDAFIHNLKNHGNYREEKISFPLTASEGSTIVYFPKNDKEKAGDGITLSDALLYHKEDQKYTKLYSQHGIRETLNYSGITTRTFLIDGYMAMEFRESAHLDFYSSDLVFLNIVPYGKDAFEITEEELRNEIGKNQKIYDTLIEISKGKNDGVQKL